MSLYCIAGSFELITMVTCPEGLPSFLVGGHRVRDIKKLPDEYLAKALCTAIL